MNHKIKNILKPVEFFGGKFNHRAFLVLFLAFLLFGVEVRADEVDDYMSAVINERHIPGAAVAIVKNGKLVKTGGYGLASLEFNVPVTPETVFEIGSISKQFTATAVMLLVEDGKIDLDEKISRYLPGTPAVWEKVTVRHLLTHTSGVKSYDGLAGFELIRRLKRDDFIKLLGTYPLDFEPGAKYNYSNSGYNLLGYIIEAASGKSYWDFVRERIFKPLGMDQTADRDPQFIIKNRATGYEWENNRWTGRDWDLTDLFSAGAIVSTVKDLAKLDLALRNDKLLKKSTKEQMWTPVKLNDGNFFPYGFGWNVTELRGHRLIAHSGQTSGFSSNISRFTDDDLTVIVFTNNGTSYARMIAARLAKIYIPAISLKSLKAQPDPDPKLSKIFLTALEDRLKNKFDPDLLTPEQFTALSTENAKTNNQRIALFGPVERFTFVGNETVGDKKSYRYRAETAKRIFLWRFAVNENGRISEMVLEEEE